ncbi:MAG: sigma-70 family RNA polymerase sigma factor [Candidatus Andeanibacterium colombiense]|uniref:Sigma-70 family RNA polymerase sigma factor n=1 Tax=Candidatus Andeanibacterium colombiense TaxID=3121345 RepID=A0AAJ5X425_9SPHN|nr:MAG: sigma-70 family RNA polymerase sigma factor [Sphingomonadaceae bacterium]
MQKIVQIDAGRITLESVFLEARKDLERVVRRRVRSVDVVGDLVQDIYMKCRRVELDFPDRREATAYLLRMASNYAIDHERVEGRREAILGDLASVYQTYDKHAGSPEAYALAEDKAKQIEAVLAKLPKRTREMFVLVRLYGMSHKEVADQLGVSKSLVDKYVLQALLECRNALGGLDRLD